MMSKGLIKFSLIVKLFAVYLLILFLQSCDSEREAKIEQEEEKKVSCVWDDVEYDGDIDLTGFLKDTIPKFYGKFNDTEFLWEYGKNDFERTIGIISLGDDLTPDGTDFWLFEFDTPESSRLVNSIRLQTPSFGENALDFCDVFSTKENRLGGKQLNHFIEVIKDKDTVSSCESSESVLKILKTKKRLIATRESNSVIRKVYRYVVWYSIPNPIEFSRCELDSDLVLTDAYIIAEYEVWE